jgi:hypothetical protein
MYEELEFKLEEVNDLGNGVVLAVVLQGLGVLASPIAFSRERDGLRVGGRLDRAPYRFRHRRGP